MVAAVQRQLIRTGFLHDSADGAMGPKTERAITAFQRANGLPVDGEPSSALLASLREQPSVEAPTAAASPAPSNAPQWETPGAAPGSASGGGAQPWATPAAAPAATANAPAVTAGSSQWSVPATAPAAAGTASP
jgi:peptidoglycan hydrolase-like protein with peptidoglycan-binding domain